MVPLQCTPNLSFSIFCLKCLFSFLLSIPAVESQALWPFLAQCCSSGSFSSMRDLLVGRKRKDISHGWMSIRKQCSEENTLQKQRSHCCCLGKGEGCMGISTMNGFKLIWYFFTLRNIQRLQLRAMFGL